MILAPCSVQLITRGRYAFGNQPGIMHWNVARLAECLLPLIHADSDQAIARVMPLIEGFAERFQTAYHAMMGRKLGFQDGQQADDELINGLLDLMQSKQLDYTETFHQLGLGFGRRRQPLSQSRVGNVA